MLLVKSLATPLIWVLALLLLGLAAMRFSRRKRVGKLGWYAVLLGTLTLLVFSFPPFANVLSYSLECQSPPPTAEALSTLDVVVVLGGGGFPSGGFRREAELAECAYPRFYHGVRTFQQGNAGVLAFCGGALRRGKEAEAEIMEAMAIRMGVPEDKIVTETTSTNTMENATGLTETLPAGQGRRIALVTSATHMLRSARVFRARFPHDTIVPVPVQYHYDPDPWHLRNMRPSAGALEQSSRAVHEWIGLLWYALRY